MSQENREIILLLDYRDQFYFSTRYRGASVDIEKLHTEFKKQGHTLFVKSFTDINFRTQNYSGKYILYQSSEDPGLRYKDYIEDIIYGLLLQGAILIPEFKYFRAHHNKVFMEVLRDILSIPEVKNIESCKFGTYEEYKKNLSLDVGKKVLKPGVGTRSRGVSLLSKDHEKNILPKKISRSFTLENFKLWISGLWTGKPYTLMSNHRKKFIVQNYIEGLKGDYRVLVYGEKLYAVFRGNRKNDFRASGSRILDFNVDVPDSVLDFAQNVYKAFNVPFMSLDIGFKDGESYLFEFQCISLGQYTLEKSSFYFCKKDDRWIKIPEVPFLERELASSVVGYISSKK